MFPSKRLLRAFARYRVVGRDEGRQPGKLSGSLLFRDGARLDAEARSDHLRNLAEGDAFFAYRVISRADFTSLEGQPKQAGRIEPMHGSPAVLAQLYISGKALFAGGAGQHGRKALSALVVSARRKPTVMAHTPAAATASNAFSDVARTPPAAWGSASSVSTATLPAAIADQRRFYAGVRDAILGRSSNPVTLIEALTVIAVIEAGATSARKQAAGALSLTDEEIARWRSVDRWEQQSA